MSSAPDATGVLTVNGERLLADLRELATIGATAEGGVNRPAYGDEDLAAREVVRQWMRAAGLAVRVDTAGNTFGRLPNLNDTPPIVIGSHTDSVPDGGRFDGALGTLAALEVARTVARHGLTLRHPLEVVNFQNEEGGIIGSKAVAGRLGADELAQTAMSGYTIAEGIRRLGGEPDRLTEAVRVAGSIAAYVELHIEQGRILERAGADIGVVEGIVGISYWEVTFNGIAAHAGATPMADRHDALLAAARFVDAVNRTVVSLPGRHVGTIGRLTVFPGAPNVVPSRVTLTLELRDLDQQRIEALFAVVAREAERIAADTGTTVALRPTTAVTPAPTDARVRGAIVFAARLHGLRSLDMPSGAGHDAQNMAAIAPSGMFFVPSVDGISHSPREFTSDADVVKGANVLLGTVLRLDATM
jgi:beta-ureidopropionase / N-carbamoyl-L-amino-acid hydrolase